MRKTIGLSALLCVMLAGMGIHAVPGAQGASLDPVFGTSADLAWQKKTGEFVVEQDSQLGKAVLRVAGPGTLTLVSRTRFTGAQQVRALVRFRTSTTVAGFNLYVAKKDEADPGLRFHTYAYKATDMISCSLFQGGASLHDNAALAEKMDWVPQRSTGYQYYTKAYTDIYPGWPEDYRARIEHDMAELPGLNEKWVDVRVELREGQVRFWLDDRLVGQKRDASIESEGLISLDLTVDAQLADFSVTQLPEEPKSFVPVRLGGYANARRFVEQASLARDALPVDKSLIVNGVPFSISGVSPKGNDHIDVGRSLFRQANMPGYNPTYLQAFAGSNYRDPARIQLRVPNGVYDALYVLAAAEKKDDAIPLLSAMFFRPGAGFAHTFEAQVPLATAASSDAVPVPVKLSNGRMAKLWLVKIPLDPGKLSSFADLDIVEIELTKKVRQYRSYPDPFIYGWHQAGAPSSVHVYGVTLGGAPVAFDFSPDAFGHVWQSPAVPAYTATLVNNTDSEYSGTLVVTTRSHDGTEETRQEEDVKLGKKGTAKVALSVPVKLYGYHDISATLEIAGKTWVEERSLVSLAPDTRSARWTKGQGTLFGYWSYGGGHYTPKADHHVRLMTMAGARTAIGLPKVGAAVQTLVDKHWDRVPAGAWEVRPQLWAKEDPYDPQKYAAYQAEVTNLYAKARAAVPERFRPDHVYFYPEPHVSLRLTAGNYPEYWGGEPYEYTEEEKANLRMYMVTSKCAAEAIRRTWSDLNILIPWGDPLFAVPLLRAGFPKDLIDGSGLDICHFERLPEQQLHQISTHRLYELRSEFAKAGIDKPVLQACEGPFVPTEVGACSWREQMDIYHRAELMMMAYGVDRFFSSFFAFDCGSYYGAEHYGGCGIQRRIPYCDPKPAYAAYATMTEQLNEANFDGWLKTGSLTTYCLRFKGPRGNVYALWTLRGKRPVTLSLTADATVTVVDSMNNGKPVQSRDKQVTVMTDPSVIYVTQAGEIGSIAVGAPDHTDATPAPDATVIADLGDGTWRYTSESDEMYENNNFDTFRYLGRFAVETTEDAEHGKVLVSTLSKQDTVRELMPWYNTLTPKKPITFDGVASAIGLWVKGASDWGRVVYCLRDAKGERWTSIGTKDQWNCDDVHSWSAFNFDGWRYVRFELPSHTGYDTFRKHGTTWWGHNDGDDVVDLPLTLERIIVEQRSHILYVNDVQPVASDNVSLGKLYLEYDLAQDATKQAVKRSRARIPLPTAPADLPNPIQAMTETGVGAPTVITKIEPPTHYYDGTRAHVYFKEVEDATAHYVWASTHADGGYAVNLTKAGTKDGGLVYYLKPAVPLYFWATYKDAKGQMSKPSPVFEQVLVDAFGQK